MDIERKSLKAVTIGPDATAGSIPSRAKKIGESTPNNVPARQDPINPTPTITPTAAGLIAEPDMPTKSKAYTNIPQRIPKTNPAINPIVASFITVSLRFAFESSPIAILRTKIVLH